MRPLPVVVEFLARCINTSRVEEKDDQFAVNKIIHTMNITKTVCVCVAVSDGCLSLTFL
jgi:hypothetical protein